MGQTDERFFLEKSAKYFTGLKRVLHDGIFSRIMVFTLVLYNLLLRNTICSEQIRNARAATKMRIMAFRLAFFLHKYDEFRNSKGIASIP